MEEPAEILTVSSDSSAERSPLPRGILCLKRRDDIERFEETDDCFILEFDPLEPDDFSTKLSLSESKGTSGDQDVVILAERGELACRDFPHSRHLCQKFPFASTPHENHCELCYCYVCDLAAPCRSWLEQGHCHASEHGEMWVLKRNEKKMERPKENVK